jgi:hypothetical protein
MRTFLLSAALVAATLGAYAQPNQYKGVVKTNPLGYFTGQFMFGYEHMLNERMSVQLMPGLVSQSSSQTLYDDMGMETSYEQKKSGFIVIPEFRYYLKPDNLGAPEGLYIAGLARVLSLTYDLTDTGAAGFYGDVSREDKRTVLGAGAVLGYAFFLDNGLSAELFVGPQFKSVTFERTYDNFSNVEVGDAAFDSKFLDVSLAGLENSGAGVRFGVNVGFGF